MSDDHLERSVLALLCQLMSLHHVTPLERRTTPGADGFGVKFGARAFGTDRQLLKFLSDFHPKVNHLLFVYMWLTFFKCFSETWSLLFDSFKDGADALSGAYDLFSVKEHG